MNENIRTMVWTVLGVVVGAVGVFFAPAGVRITIDLAIVVGMFWMAWTLGRDARRRIRILGWPRAWRHILPHVGLVLGGFCMVALSTLLLLVEANLLSGAR